jgi:hypothetical protein
MIHLSLETKSGRSKIGRRLEFIENHSFLPSSIDKRLEIDSHHRAISPSLQECLYNDSFDHLCLFHLQSLSFEIYLDILRSLGVDET